MEPMKKTSIRFSSGALSLEGVLDAPEGAGSFPAVIVCHPHPLYGGTMDNNVVNGVCEAITRASFVSFKFNFRGVGGSEGEFGQGIGEQEDIKAAILFLATVQEVDCSRIGVVGYSAGATFAFPVVSRDHRVKAIAAVSPPLTNSDYQFLKMCPKPKFLISGSMDDIIPAKQFLKFCQSMVEPKEYEIIKGADHFWLGYESEVADKVSCFFAKAL